MSLPKDNSSLRYFLAGLKPFTRFMFWGPLGFLALLLLGYWQVQQNPAWISPITELVPTNPEAEILPEPSGNSVPAVAPPTAGSPSEQPRNWTEQERARLKQETLLQPFSLDQPNQKKKNQGNRNPVPESTPNSSSLFTPLLPPVQSNSQPNYNPVKPLQVQPIPVGENQLQRAMERSSLNTPASSTGYAPGNAPPVGQSLPASPAVNSAAPPYSNYPPGVAPAPTYQPTNPGYGNNPPVGYQNQAPANPYSQPPAYRGAQIQPSIQAAPAGY